jgi:DNA-binding beta-propeller fold protein YncE
MEEQNEKSPPSSSGLDLTVLNSATKESVVYSGDADDLFCTLTNNTGGDISLQTGSNPSTLEIFLPDFYQPADLKKMQIKVDDWSFGVNSGDISLVLTCTQAHAWKSGDPLSFQIKGAQSLEGPPQGGPTQINPKWMTGNNIPSEVETLIPLSLQKKPDGNKGDLAQVLKPSLDNAGRIYISDSDSHLVSNTVLLTLENIGAEPLFPGSGPWPSNPSALVWFVYGDTAGALTPDDPSTPKEQSAWNIQYGKIISEGNAWSFAPVNPKTKHPQWSLTPTPVNPGILGTGDQASITFEFTQVVSKTPIGHTRMYVQCSDFPGYNDALFVLDIDKQELPSPRLIDFTSDVDKVIVHSADDKVKIPLRWTMTGVSKIILDFAVPGITLDPFPKPYSGTQPLLQLDSYQLEFSGLEQSATLMVTCKGYGESGLLNDLQQNVVLDFPPAVTGYTGKLQPDGSLLLEWTTMGATTVSLNPDLNSQTLDQKGHLSVPKPPLPLMKNDLYALTALNDQGEKSDAQVFTKCQKFGVLLPALAVGNLPESFAVLPDSGHVFVINSPHSGDNYISVIEVDLNKNPPFQVLSTRVSTQGIPTGTAVSPINSKFGKYVFVANLDSVTVFAGTPPFQIISPTVPTGATTGRLAISPDGRYVFVPLDAEIVPENAVAVIDTASAPSFTVVQGPAFSGAHTTVITGLAVSPDGNYIFASDLLNHSLWVLQVEAGANPPYRVLSPALGLEESPWGVAVSPNGHYVFTVNLDGNSVSVIDLSKGPPFRVLSPPVAAGPSPWGLVVSPDGRFLFVSNSYKDGHEFNGVSVLVIDENSDPPVKFLQTLSVGTSPEGIAVSPDGPFIFVANNLDNTVSVIEAVEVSM